MEEFFKQIVLFEFETDDFFYFQHFENIHSLKKFFRYKNTDVCSPLSQRLFLF
ncbi:hypothetical protein D920_02789 [Enterococcus faecalis 13-SD-W-01]|nr:hypothetical protein D920_02789 [Enterococcus faecalis 13-SD-W-01]